MNKKILSILGVVIAILISIKVFSSFESEKDKIKRIVLSAKEATEKEDLLKCIWYISDAYNDRDGNNKSNLFMLGHQVFKAYDNILIEITKLDVSIVDKTKAAAHIICVGQGKRSDALKNTLDIQRLEFEIIFRKEDNHWKVIELKFIEPQNFLQLLKGAV